MAPPTTRLMAALAAFAMASAAFYACFRSGLSHSYVQYGKFARAQSYQGARARCRTSAMSSRRDMMMAGGIMGLTAALEPLAANAGEILAYRRSELNDVNTKIKAANIPADLAEASIEQQTLLAEKTVLETSIDFLESNQRYLQSEVANIKTKDGRFIQHMVLKVPNLDKEVDFWTKGYGMKVVRARTVNGVRTAFIANSPESLKEEDGGAFALELVETGKPVDVGNGLAYLQLRVGDTPRVSELLRYSKSIDYAYGYLQTTSPAGYKVTLYVQDARRDPFELIALRVKDVNATKKFYEDALGMREVGMRDNGKYVDAYGPLYGFGGLLKKEFEKEDPTIPKPPEGCVYMTYGKNENDTMGVLLIPQQIDFQVGAISYPKGAEINVGNGYSKLAILTSDVYKERQTMESFKGSYKPTFGLTGPVPGIGTKVAVFTDPDGYSGVYVDYDDFESEQPPSTKPTSLLAEFEEAMEQANREAKAMMDKQKKIEEYEALGDAVRIQGA